MAIWLPLFLAAVTVRQDDTPLRTGGCDVDAPIVAKLSAATKVDIKFSLAMGSEPCYKVEVVIDGAKRYGYLSAAALVNRAEFDKATQEGGLISGNSEGVRKALSGGSPTHSPIQQASQLLEANQPGAALMLLEPLVKESSSDPDVYAIAGYAAWRNDQPKDALEYWRTSLFMRYDKNLEALYAKVEREVKSDKSSERLVGLRVLLRYERDMMPMAEARQMADILDGEVSRVSDSVGCPSSERLVAIVQSREAYFQTTQAAEWSGGQYNGRIRIPYDPSLSRVAMQRLFAHEVVHACLANLGTWPPWFHEGMAQKLSGEKLNPAMKDRITQLAASGALPKLENMRRDWSGLSTDNATIAYGVALAAADLFFEHYSNTGLLNVLRNPNQMAQITADLNARLGLK